MIEKYTISANLYNYQQGTPTAFKYLDASGQEVPVSEIAPWYITDYIPIDVDTNTITLSMIGGGAPAMCAYDSNKDFLSGVQYNTGSAINKQPITITANENIKYIRFSYFLGNSGYDDLATKMLNAGDSALPFEPYGNIWKNYTPSQYNGAAFVIATGQPEQYNGGWS